MGWLVVREGKVQVKRGEGRGGGSRVWWGLSFGDVLV